MQHQCISVVIPAFKRDALLTECLESLAVQTLPLHEVVVVDDGGSGSAREVVEKFGPRFRYLWQPNGGMQSARNHGARASTGEWIAFLDDDDLWLSDRHAWAAELIATDRVDLISGDFTKFGDGWLAPNGVFDEIAQHSPGFWDGIPRESGGAYSIIGSFPTTRLLPVYPFWPSTLVIRRDLFNRLNGWDESLKNENVAAEDFDFIFRAIKFGRLGIIWKSTVLYRSHSGNSSGIDIKVMLGRIQIWESVQKKQTLTQDEKEKFVHTIAKGLSDAQWSAFKTNDWHMVKKLSAKIGWANLSPSEKARELISKVRLIF